LFVRRSIEPQSFRLSLSLLSHAQLFMELINMDNAGSRSLEKKQRQSEKYNKAPVYNFKKVIRVHLELNKAFLQLKNSFITAHLFICCNTFFSSS
jgi:hypothetical protein